MRIAFVIVLVAGCGRIGFEDRTSAGSDASIDARVTPLAARGYFIELGGQLSSDFGGLAGADARCFNAISTNPWRDKALAVADGQIVAAKIRAWLCSTVTCRNLVAGDTYQYASLVDPAAGGGRFVAATNGYHPDDGRMYADAVVFGDHGMLSEYATGRDQDNVPQSDGTCGDWTSTAGETRVAVSDTSYHPERLAKYPRSCIDVRAIVCIVDR